MIANRKLLISMLAFLGLGAIGGGTALIISPNGNLMGMPLSMLKISPFKSFFIPGIILLSILGIAPMLLIIALLNQPSSRFAERFNFFVDMHWSWTFSIYIAIALIGWLQIQMMMLNSVSWLHTFYMLLAVAIIFVALLPQVRKYYYK
ncbi:MAG TPA: hypothetical protein ENH87_20220 [Pricia antarctica]|uniref:Uncharacterized protein n=2 Tax=root TaxID=1 RepID=A0A831QRJ4_9FLAO|nr:hypothetical protein [Pricia antarctica]